MYNNHIASYYKKTDRLSGMRVEDANSILIRCFDELINSIKLFHEHIVPNTENFRKKSSSFSRALTILYSLQSSIDFENELSVAKSLFQIYEFTRVSLIEEFKSCKIGKSSKALTALSEIRDSWKLIK